MKQKLDNILNRYLSRKLMIVLIATIGLFLGVLEGENWTLLALVYITAQGAIDAAERLYNAKKGGRYETGRLD